MSINNATPEEWTRVAAKYTNNALFDAPAVNPDHYSRNEIEPIDYVLANNLGFCEGNVIKYITRWRMKGGIEDLEKAKRYIDFLITAELAKKNSMGE